MDPKLTEMYSKMLLNEKKEKPTEMKKGVPTAPKGAPRIKPGHGFDGAESNGKPVKGTGPESPGAKKSVKKPKAINDSFIGMSKFERIFRNTLLEDTESPEGEVAQPPMPPAGLPGVPGVGEPSAEGDEVESELGGEDGDIIADLRDVVSKLQDILHTLGVEDEEGEEEEEVEQEMDGKSDVNGDINNVESAGSEVSSEEGVTESLKSAISELKASFGKLQGKLNKVEGKVKPVTGKASPGESVGKPLHSSNLHAKGHMSVTSKLKPGKSLFERRFRK
jgi:hypothetical protein